MKKPRKRSVFKSVVLPAQVRSIGRNAFTGCKKLEEIVLPDGIESLDKPAILDCPALKRVVIPASVTSIHNDNVFKCGDAAVVTPKNSYAWNWALSWKIPVLELE